MLVGRYSETGAGHRIATFGLSQLSGRLSAGGTDDRIGRAGAAAANGAQTIASPRHKRSCREPALKQQPVRNASEAQTSRVGHPDSTARGRPQGLPSSSVLRPV